MAHRNAHARALTFRVTGHVAPSRAHAGTRTVQPKLAFTVGTLDDTLRGSIARISHHKLGVAIAGGAVPELATAAAGALAALSDDDTLYLDGHGAAAAVVGVPQAAQLFGDMAPEALANLVLQKGLKASFAGKIYLNGCNTATGNGVTYAHRFQLALSLRGVRCVVKGNAGYSQVAPDGRTRVAPSTQQGAAERATFRQLSSQLRALKPRIDTLELEVANNRHPQWDAKYAELKQLLTDASNLKTRVDNQHARTFLHDKALRPGLPAPGGITHYESDAGIYRALPNATGVSGRSLDQHVRDALAAYRSKWKFNPSTASTAAVIVLNGALGSFPALLMAAYWYVQLGPKPPIQLVATGAALDRSSSLYLFLLRELMFWQTGRRG